MKPPRRKKSGRRKQRKKNKAAAERDELVKEVESILDYLTISFDDSDDEQTYDIATGKPTKAATLSSELVQDMNKLYDVDVQKEYIDVIMKHAAEHQEASRENSELDMKDKKKSRLEKFNDGEIEPPPGCDVDSWLYCEELAEWTPEDRRIYNDMKRAVTRSRCSRAALWLSLAMIIPVMYIVLVQVGFPVAKYMMHEMGIEAMKGWTHVGKLAVMSPGWIIMSLLCLVFTVFAYAGPWFLWFAGMIAITAWAMTWIEKVKGQLNRNLSCARELDKVLWEHSKKEGSGIDYKTFGLGLDHETIDEKTSNIESILGKELAEEYRKLKTAE